MTSDVTRRQLLALAASSAFGKPLDTTRSVIFRGRDGGATYFQPRACALPGPSPPRIFLTAAPVTGDDVFWNLHWSESRDLGTSWSEPKPLPGLARVQHPDGITEELLADAGPEYHAPTGAVIILGDNVYYAKDGHTQTVLPGHRWQQPVYMTGGRDGNWSAPRKLEWDDPRGSAMINAGNTQRVTLPGGDILLALSHAPRERYADGPLGSRGKLASGAFDRGVSVARCSFDGKTLAVRRVSAEFRLPVKRGLIEPSLAAYGGRFYLTMRAEDDRGYVSVSDDGLVWEKMRPWAWESGEAITTSTTQQRWLVFDGRLFLVYTRRTSENEKVIRWRAPLLMAEVDAKRMHLKRATEQVVFP
ncbi:MAG: exo-alpha-sialidase, partial [Bryobacteraceae bacterium]